MGEGLIVAVDAPGATAFYVIRQNRRSAVCQNRCVLRHRFERDDTETLVRRRIHKQHRAGHQPELLLITDKAFELNVFMPGNWNVVLAGYDEAKVRRLCLLES